MNRTTLVIQLMLIGLWGALFQHCIDRGHFGEAIWPIVGMATSAWWVSTAIMPMRNKSL